MDPLDDVDRRIAAALLRDGRASWRAIASILGEPERVVARRGARLLDSGAVRIVGQANPRNRPTGESTLLRVTATPRALAAVAAHLADDPRSLWVSVLAGPAEVVGEIFHDRGELRGIIAGLAAIDGVIALDARPELRFHRTVSGWSPGILSPAQLEALRPGEDVTLAAWPSHVEPDETTSELIALLAYDGRATLDDLATRLGSSISTVSRRLEAAIAHGQVSIRAMVDPALLGAPVETFLTVECVAGGLEQVGALLSTLPTTRWAIDDGTRVFAQLAHRDRRHLEDTLRRLTAVPDLDRLSTSEFIEVAKRSTVRYRGGIPLAREAV